MSLWKLKKEKKENPIGQKNAIFERTDTLRWQLWPGPGAEVPVSSSGLPILLPSRYRTPESSCRISASYSTPPRLPEEAPLLKEFGPFVVALSPCSPSSAFNPWVGPALIPAGC
jgi:hypothetical protein